MQASADNAQPVGQAIGGFDLQRFAEDGLNRVDNKDEFIAWLRGFVAPQNGGHRGLGTRRRSLSKLTQRDLRELSQMTPPELAKEVAREGYQRLVDTVEANYEAAAPVARMMLRGCGGGGDDSS